MNFGRNLAIRLMDKNMTKCEFANKVGVSISTISKICKKQRMPSCDLALKIADALETTVDDLMKGDAEYAKGKSRVSRHH